MKYPHSFPLWRSNGELLPGGAPSRLVLSSVCTKWNDVVVEQHHFPSSELADVMHKQHMIAINVGHCITWEFKKEGRLHHAFKARGAISCFPSHQPFSAWLKVEKGRFANFLFLTLGLADVIKLRPGEVIFISGAAGAVGSIACQIAKLMGATVIASAGGVEKCAYLKQLGIEKVIDYKKTEDLSQALAEIAPSGIDAYFDNVGGDHLDAALASAKTFARFALCGMISGYDKTVSGPSNLLMAIEKRLLLEGFLVADHFSRKAEFIEKMNGWIRNGDVTYRETVEVGIERAPAAFLKLFSGESVGKMLVKLV